MTETSEPIHVRSGLDRFTEVLTPSAVCRTDWRVERVLGELRETPEEVRSLGELAGGVRLSDERLRHLIRDALGVPFTRYRSWRRLYRAVAHLTEGRNITRSAHEAGFSDSAHFARTFKSFFSDSITGRLRRDGQPLAQGVWLDAV